jgi:hypothetical protein
MKVNVYKEEQTPEVMIVHQTAKTGSAYFGVSFILHSPKELHQGGSDDDRSAVTFWGTSREELLELLSRAVEKLQMSK